MVELVSKWRWWRWTLGKVNELMI